jgi:predicted MFS family arabinose efflux permease
MQALRRDKDTWRWYGFVGLFAYLLYALGAVTPYLKADFALNDFLVGLHSSAFALGLMVSGLVGDRLAARVPPSALMVGTAVVEAVAAASIALAPCPAASIAAAFAMGLCGSLMLALVNASINRRHQHHSARVLTEAQVAASLFSLSTALLLGLVVWLRLGWRLVLVLPIALIAAAWFARANWNCRPSSIDQRRAQAGREGIHARRRATARPVQSKAAGLALRLPLVFWLRWVVAVAVIAVEFALVFWGPSALRISPGLGSSAASAAMAFFIGGMLAGRVLGSLLFSRVTAGLILPIGAGMAAAGALILRQSTGLAASIIGLLMAGLGVANLYPIAVDAAIRAAPGQAVKAAARCSFAFGVALFAGPPILGALADHFGILDALWTVVVLAAGAAIFHVVAAWMPAQKGTV